MALLRIQVSHAAENLIARLKAELSTRGVAIDPIRGEDVRIHRREEGSNAISEFSSARMHFCNCPTGGHDNIGEAEDERHHGATERHRRTRVEDLPDDRCSLESGGNRRMRIHQAADLDEIDASLADDPPNGANLTRQIAEKPKLVNRIPRCAEAMKRDEHEFDARMAKPFRSVPGLVGQDDGHRYALSLERARQEHCLVVRATEDGVVNDEENVHANKLSRLTDRAAPSPGVRGSGHRENRVDRVLERLRPDVGRLPSDLLSRGVAHLLP